MRYCLRCLYPANHPLHLCFDKAGICSGCRVHEEKDTIDWSERSSKLGLILKNYKNNSGKSYDCIIPVTGARDSFFIVHVIKNVYKMRPLLVSYNMQFNTERGIRNLARLRTIFDCDILFQTVNPIAVKQVTRHTLEKFGSIYWHCLAGQTVFPIHIAVRFKIPLIIWGVHQGCDQVGMFSHLDEVEMTRKYRKNHDLMGIEAEDLLKDSGCSENDLRPYFYPFDKELEVVGVRGIYLSNYLRWDSIGQHKNMIEEYGYYTVSQQRTFDIYNDADSFVYSDLHDYIKFIKWGYGKVSDHASREIRLKRLTRTEGIQLVRSFQWQQPQHQHLFFDWIDLNPDTFKSMIDKHRDSSIWKKEPGGEWTLLNSVDRQESDTETKRVAGDISKISISCDAWAKNPDFLDDHYVLNSKGWQGYEL